MTNRRSDDKLMAKAVAFIRKEHGAVTPDHLLAWDAKNGKKLFEWNDARAAAKYREARAFDRLRIKPTRAHRPRAYRAIE